MDTSSGKNKLKNMYEAAALRVGVSWCRGERLSGGPRGVYPRKILFLRKKPFLKGQQPQLRPDCLCALVSSAYSVFQHCYTM